LNIDERITSLNEKAAVKRKRLAAIMQDIEKKKAVAQALTAEIKGYEKNIFDLEAQRLLDKLKSKGVGITSVIEAVEAGIFDEKSCAINSTEQKTQEDKTDEISSSGKTVGNA